ncbi:TetR/AcrR family transcriptional regulator [Peptacetobacter sp.]|uniref:TetR/AcrR family transcriptional regulator n=1 Tax=Peptacetobacter sp. TaxID=2991975 RepID=UPI00261A0B4B|nr:TetR/AcrR family transcriptional regulator [Peptacetobacter sp.]
MNRYKKGLNTCNYIVEESKKLFYLKGYSKTTIQEICDNTNITLGNFTYYFKTKQDLLKRVYLDYLKEIENFVIENSEEYPNLFDKYLLSCIIFNNNLFADKNISNFNYSIIKNDSLYNDIFLSIPSEEIKLAYGNINENISRRELKLLYLSDLGTRKELTKYFVENEELFESPLDFSANLAEIISRIYKFENININEKFLKNSDLLEKIKNNGIYLLTPTNK